MLWPDVTYITSTNSLVTSWLCPTARRAEQCRKACLCCGGSRALGQGHIGLHLYGSVTLTLKNIIFELHTNQHIRVLQWPQTIPPRRSCHLPETAQGSQIHQHVNGPKQLITNRAKLTQSIRSSVCAKSNAQMVWDIIGGGERILCEANRPYKDWKYTLTSWFLCSTLPSTLGQNSREK